MAEPDRPGTYAGEMVFKDDEWWSWINGRWTNAVVQPDTVIEPGGAP